MSKEFLTVLFTFCPEQSLRNFISKINLSDKCNVAQDGSGDLICHLDSSSLEFLFDQVKIEAEKGWENPDDSEVLQFDSAFFPHSEEIIMPIKQLKGIVAARLDRKKRNLPPAYATPGYVFGTAEQQKS